MRVPNHQAASSVEEAQALHRSALQQAFDRLQPSTQRAVMDLSSSTSLVLTVIVVVVVVAVLLTVLPIGWYKCTKPAIS